MPQDQRRFHILPLGQAAHVGKCPIFSAFLVGRDRLRPKLVVCDIGARKPNSFLPERGRFSAASYCHNAINFGKKIKQPITAEPMDMTRTAPLAISRASRRWGLKSVEIERARASHAEFTNSAVITELIHRISNPHSQGSHFKVNAKIITAMAAI